MAESRAREAMEKSRLDVVRCEEEIKSIKNALRALTVGSGDTPDVPPSNRLEVSVLHVVPSGGGDDASSMTTIAPTTFKIQISSPIEERILTKLYDPLNPTAVEGLAVFSSLESLNALLSVEAYALDGAELSGRKLLGTSVPHDLQPLCSDNELWRKGGTKMVSSLDVAIVAGGGVGGDAGSMPLVTSVEERESSSESWEDAVADEEEKTNDSDEVDAHIGEVIAENLGVKEKKVLLLPLCTLTLQLTYYPSAEEKRDALYDNLNEVSKRKVAAIELLRKNAGIVNRARAADEAESGDSKKSDGGPAVKSGFLNRSKAEEEKSPPLWKRWYDKTLGPSSMLWVVGPIATNYVLFVGVSLFLHFKGDLLALPPPV